MGLLVFGQILNDAEFLADRIKFGLPQLSGWKKFTGSIYIEPLVAPTGMLHVDIQGSTSNDDVNLSIAFSIEAIIIGELWQPIDGAISTEVVRFQITTEKPRAPIDLKFSMLSIVGQDAHQFEIRAGGAGLVYFVPLTSFQIGSDDDYGIFRLSVESSLIGLNLAGAAPLLQFPQGSLRITALLRQGSSLLSVGRHDLALPVELPLAKFKATQTCELEFSSPPSPRDSVPYRLPLSAFLDKRQEFQRWTCPLAISNYQLKVTWKGPSRLIEKIIAAPAGPGGTCSIWLLNCIDQNSVPLELTSNESLKLGVALRSAANGILARLAILSSPVRVTTTSATGSRRLSGFASGMFWVIGAGERPLGDLNVRFSAKPTSSAFGCLGKELLVSELVQILEVPGSFVEEIHFTSDEPFHDSSVSSGAQNLESFRLWPEPSKILLLPLCGIDTEYLLPSTKLRRNVLRDMDAALSLCPIGGNRSPYPAGAWVRQRGPRLERIPLVEGGVITLKSFFVSGSDVPELKLKPHQIIETFGTVQVTTVEKPPGTFRAQRLASGYRIITNIDQLEVREGTLSTPLEQREAFLLSGNKRHWFTKPKRAMPLAYARTQVSERMVWEDLKEALGPAYASLAEEFVDYDAFPTWWTGTILFDVNVMVRKDHPIAATMGDRIEFAYVAFFQDFEKNDQGPVRVTKALANKAINLPIDPAPPLPTALVDGHYQVEWREVRIANHAIKQLDLRAAVYLYFFLGVSVTDDCTGKSLKVGLTGRYDATRDHFAVTSSSAVRGVNARLDRIKSEMWPFERIELTRIRVRLDTDKGKASLRLMLDGSISLKSRFGKVFNKTDAMPLEFADIELFAMDSPSARTRNSRADPDTALKLLNLSYTAAKWALDAARFNLGSQLAKARFEGMAYSIEGSLADAFPSTLFTPRYAGNGYIALRFSLAIEIPGGARRQTIATGFGIVVAWRLDSNHAPIVGDDPYLGLSFQGMKNFALPIFPGVLLSAKSFSMEVVTPPGTKEQLPWFALKGATLTTGLGNLFVGREFSVGMFIRSDGSSGFAAAYRNPQPDGGAAQLRWLLIARNMTIDPQLGPINELLAPGDTAEQDALAGALSELIDGANPASLLPMTRDSTVGDWLVAAGLKFNGNAINAKFLHQDGNFSGITVDGPLIRAVLGGKSISLRYYAGATPQDDRYETILSLPSVKMSGFRIDGGTLRLTLSQIGDFLLDASFPFPNAKGVRQWSRSMLFYIGTFQCLGGFYLARYHGALPDVVDRAGNARAFRISFGSAAAWGVASGIELDWFSAHIFLGFTATFEATLLCEDDTIHIERLAGSGGVLLTATAQVSLWIISVRVTLQAYAEIQIEFTNAPALAIERPQALDMSGMPVNSKSLIARIDDADRKITLSATFTLEISVVIEIDLYFYSSKTTISASCTYPVRHEIPL